MAKASVVMHSVGRVFGGGMWNPFYLSAFPPQFFLTIIGINAVGRKVYQQYSILEVSPCTKIELPIGSIT